MKPLKLQKVMKDLLIIFIGQWYIVTTLEFQNSFKKNFELKKK